MEWNLITIYVVAGFTSGGILAGAALGYYTARADEREEQHARQDPR